ncbi:hypothetical protein SLEP1_g9866 [Rubroshorea leprosula]|uniref:Non-specific lipid-transfer protein n=1 Tax=Rubroshorea leprosula TaxID=152421 RepID=A0AAV5IH90_9ROSI|nr:hypothetical protein SLEP1_g9866 [Rubroshorea leprosula]
MACHMRYLILFLVLSTSVLAQTPDAPPCSQIVKDVGPCLSFLTDGGEPTKECCAGITEIANYAKSKKDRVAICNCLKKALAQIGSYDASRIPQLPVKCGISSGTIPPIDQNTDCSKASTLVLV